MSHREPTESSREQAALYALGSMDGAGRASYESHLAEGCGVCEAELRELRAVAGLLGTAVDPVPPRPALRQRLLDRLRESRGAETVSRATEADWQATGLPGVSVRWLSRDPAGGRRTAVARLAPDSAYPAHRHADTEELYVLGGLLTVEGRDLRAGDYCAAPAGTSHRSSVSPDGCTFLVVSSSADQLLAEPDPHAGEGVVFQHAAEARWEPGPTPGVERRPLRVGPTTDGSMSVVRLLPGAGLPVVPGALEQLYVLQGDVHVGGVVLGRGDHYRPPVDSAAEGPRTEGGCTVLLIASDAPPA